MAADLRLQLRLRLRMSECAVAGKGRSRGVGAAAGAAIGAEARAGNGSDLDGSAKDARQHGHGEGASVLGRLVLHSVARELAVAPAADTRWPDFVQHPATLQLPPLQLPLHSCHWRIAPGRS
eukprot:scaffold16813_cov55-Phaeocystis_antarctica.AAC.2